jgi:hypothetical protein
MTYQRMFWKVIVPATDESVPATDDLPPLPTAAWTGWCPRSVVSDPDAMYTADQMHSYARAAIEDQRAKNERLRELLRETRGILMASAVMGAGDMIDRIDAMLAS